MKTSGPRRLKAAVSAFLLAAALLIAGCAGAESPAVRVNDRTFSVETVQKYIDETAVNMPLTLGDTVQNIFGGAETEFLEAAAEHFVTVAIIEDRLHAKGLDKLTDEETETLQDYARQTYDQIWQDISDALKEAYPEEEQSDRLVTETMESAGYSMDGIYEKAVQSLMLERFANAFCTDVSVTDEEVREFYRTTYTEPDRELYEHDIGTFEERVLFGGESSTYIPEGYFYIKYIVLKPSEERVSAISQAESALAGARAEAEAAEAELVRAALDSSADLTAPRDRYQAAAEAEEQALAALAEQKRLAEKDLAPMAELFRSALAEGESFESLIGKHSVQQSYTGRDEPGYPFHPDSPNWEDGVRERIAALEKQGDCTDPVYTAGSVCVYCRMDDMDGGAYEPDENTWAELRASLLQAKQSTAADEKVAAWRGEYKIEIDLTGLVFPET
ncbi:MAG: hypothetical protein Q4G19_01290 [Clostridia bacterium]|nr:hypothetical protein [Clostridia bacterium]